MNNLRNKLKVLIKVTSNEDSNIEISKISSVVSQYGVEDTNLLDSQIAQSLNFNNLIYLPQGTFYFSIKIYLFRDETDTVLIINNYEKNSLLKFLFDNNKKKFIKKKYNTFLLMNLSSNLDFYYKFINFKKTIRGTLLSYRQRDKMKSRKINFRRKIKKNTYEE